MVKTISLWLKSKPSQKQHVIVLGAPRSGTSLVKNLLITHPELDGTDQESTGLIRFRDFARFQLEELAHERYSQILDRATHLPELYDLIANEYSPDIEGRVFVDKVSISAWRLRYMNKFFPLCRYINVIRDGRDSYCSALHHRSIKQASSLETFASYWKSCIDLPRNLLASRQLHLLKYEDLVSDPEATLSKAMKFLSLEFDKCQVDPACYSRVSALRKRPEHRNLGRPISANSIGKWKLELSKDQAQEFWRIAEQALESCGYHNC